MHKFTYFFFLFPLIINARLAPNDLIKFQSYIGDWYIVSTPEMLDQFPETKDMIGFRFEWDDPNQKILRYYEGIPNGDLKQMILGTIVTQNPRTGTLEFMGYQTRDDFLFKGQFHFLEEDKGFIRHYDVYYPHHTKFRNRQDSLRGIITYRDICKLQGSDTLECVVEKQVSGLWKPWGKGKPFYMCRKPSPPHPIPQEVRDSWAMYTKNGGIWITENSQYKNDQEPFDAYGMEWEWGLGQSHIKGRLYCIQDGKDVGTVWQFLNFWDPQNQEEKIIQIGSTGMIGQGSISYQDDGSSKSSEKFVNPDGGSFESGHHSWFKDGALHTQSYDINNNKWTKRRFYIWKQNPLSEISIPEIYKPIGWLIGEWNYSMGDRTASMRFTWSENQRMIFYESGMTPKAGAPEEKEAEGIITYHGVKDQLVFMNTYLQPGSHLISEGQYIIQPNGDIHRLFTCHYKYGDTLPWSDGAKAPQGGKSIEFKQIWTPVDNNTFTGNFYWKKYGQWENPIKEVKRNKEVWKRVVD